MRTIDGYDVKIFTDNVESSALEQIEELLSIEVLRIRRFVLCPMFMPEQDV